jgi:hypothetical protein
LTTVSVSYTQKLIAAIEPGERVVGAVVGWEQQLVTMLGGVHDRFIGRRPSFLAFLSR